MRLRMRPHIHPSVDFATLLLARGRPSVTSDRAQIQNEYDECHVVCHGGFQGQCRGNALNVTRSTSLKPLAGVKRSASAGIMSRSDAPDKVGFQLEQDRFVRRHHRAWQRIEPVISHMVQNSNQRLRIDALAAIAGVSTSRFYGLFKSATASSPLVFFIRIRIQHACDLLRRRDLTVKQVAHLLGYNDQFYFSRVFKSVVGVSPRAYRNKLAVPDPGKTAALYALPQYLPNVHARWIEQCTVRRQIFG